MSLIRNMDGTVSSTTSTANSATLFNDGNSNDAVSTSALKNQSASVYVDNGYVVDAALNENSVRAVANKVLTAKFDEVNQRIESIEKTGVTDEQFEELANKFAASDTVLQTEVEERKAANEQIIQDTTTSFNTVKDEIEVLDEEVQSVSEKVGKSEEDLKQTQKELELKADLDNYEQNIVANDLKAVGVNNLGSTYFGPFRSVAEGYDPKPVKNGRYFQENISKPILANERGFGKLYLNNISYSAKERVDWIAKAAEHSTITDSQRLAPFPEGIGIPISYFSLYIHALMPSSGSMYPPYCLLSYDKTKDTAYLKYVYYDATQQEPRPITKPLVTYYNVSNDTQVDYNRTILYPENYYGELYDADFLFDMSPKFSFDDSYDELDNFYNNFSKIIFNYDADVISPSEKDVRSGNVYINGKTRFYGEIECHGSTIDLNNSSLYDANELSVKGSATFEGKVNFNNSIEIVAGLSLGAEILVKGTSQLEGNVNIGSSLTVSGTTRTNGDLVTTKIKPKEDSKYDIGNNSKHYKNIYLSNGIVTGTDSANQFTQKLQQKEGTIALTSDIEEKITAETTRATAKETELEGKIENLSTSDTASAEKIAALETRCETLEKQLETLQEYTDSLAEFIDTLTYDTNTLNCNS